MDKKLNIKGVDSGHRYVVIGFTDVLTSEEKVVAFAEKFNVQRPDVNFSSGDQGQGDPGKGGLGGGAYPDFKRGRQEVKDTVDDRYYGAIEFPTVGTARKWLESTVGKAFIDSYQVVFIQATIGCPKTDDEGL